MAHRYLKILGKAVSTAAMLLIAVPLLVSLLLHLPAVQNWVIDQAARTISRRIGTEVSIDRIDLVLPGKVRIRGLCVEDFERDTLLYAGRIDAYVTSPGLSGGGIRLFRGELSDAKLYLRETPEGVMNIKQVIDRLSRKDHRRKGNFRLSIGTASIRNMEFRLRKLQSRKRESGIDFSDLRLTELNARMENFEIDGAAISARIDALSGREQSGFRLDELSGAFYLNDGCIGFDNAHILTEHSNLRLPRISLVGGSWPAFSDFIGEVLIDAEIERSTLSSDDVAQFAPSLRDWHVDLRDIGLALSGTVADFSGECRSLEAGRTTALAAKFHIRGLPDLPSSRFDVDILRLRSSAEDIRRFAAGIGRQELSPAVRDMLRNGGTMNLTGRFDGAFSDFKFNASLATAAGSARCDLRVRPLNRRLRSVDGSVAARNLRLGRLLGNPLFDRITVKADIDGAMGRDSADLKIEGRVADFDMNGYSYDSLKFAGRLRNREFDGRIVSYDPNLRFDFTGLLNFNREIPDFDFRLDLRHADLQAIRVNRRDSVATLKARVRALGSGNSPDNMNGWIVVSDARYRYNDKELSSDRFTLQGENSAESKFLQLESDFVDAAFRSRASYREILEYLRLSMWKYLPMLYEPGAEEQRNHMRLDFADAYSMLTVKLKDPNPVADAIVEGLQVAEGSELDMHFNPATDRLSLRLTSDYVQRDRLLITRLNINAGNRGDSLTMYLKTEDIYAGSLHLTSLDMLGGAREGQLRFSTSFADSIGRISGLLGFTAAVAPHTGPHGRSIDVTLAPSHLTRGDKRWQITSDGITIDTARVEIRRLVMDNRGQELLVDGVASRSRDDSVTLRLENFDLEPFTQFVENIGYVIEGRTNGYATVKSALRQSEISARILLDSVRVNSLPAPPLLLTSQWDFQQNRAGILVRDRIRRDTLVQGFYDPSQVRYYASIRIDSLQMGLLDPILSGVISETSGKAEAQLTLSGMRRNASLRGIIRVHNLRTTVDYTQTTYTMPEALVTVENNRFMADDVPLYDQEGNRGSFDLDLSLQHLSNISYDIWIAPQRMLVLNTTQQDNDLFYGKVYASGIANIRGDKRGVKMDITAQTDDNTDFFMPLSSKSNISYADFVVFEKADRPDTTTHLMRKKLLFARRQKGKNTERASMEISMALNVRPNADFQLVIDPTVGDIIKGRGEGSFNLRIRPQDNLFEMYGDYTITEGSYLFTLQNIINKKFIIESGSTLQWTGKPLDALLNINAVYKLKASLSPLLPSASLGGGDRNSRAVPVECIIHLGDRLTNPSISFEVKIPNADADTQAAVANMLNTETDVARQFVALLAMNSFYPENSAQSSSSIGAMASASTGMELLSNQVSNWLSNDDYNIVIRYRPKSELTGDEVDFGFSKSLINNRLFVEVEGNYLIDNRQAVNNDMSNFMGEAYITWLIDRTGNLKLKGFTQTIDRFDENQGLQEHGIGIYYKEDFNNFKDLRERIRNRFTNKKRQARRAARRAAKALPPPQQETAAPAPSAAASQPANAKKLK